MWPILTDNGSVIQHRQHINGSQWRNNVRMASMACGNVAMWRNGNVAS
jgi:hypothetical protein